MLILQEQWAPFRLILALMHFGLMWDHGNICVAILDEAVDLIQRTVDINAIPRYKRTQEMVPEIDVNKCLALLESIAFGAMVEEQHLRRYHLTEGILSTDFRMLTTTQVLEASTV